MTSADQPLGSRTGLGDINVFDVLLFKAGQINLGLGPQLTLPSATNDRLGTGRWQAGPAAVLIAPESWGLLGALVTYQHSFAGGDGRLVQNNLQAQPFVIYNLPQGFYLRSTATWNFDLERGAYYIPLGFGAGKIWTLTDGTTVNLFAEPQYRDAYIYAYPLILQDWTRLQTSNFARSDAFPHAPPNRFAHARAFPPADMKVVIRMNVDTLYSTAWLDLGPEPVVLSVAATERYFMLPMLSLWTDVFAVAGTRTTGRNRAVDFLVAGPKWLGDVPAGLELIKAPTRYMGIIGRTQTNGPSDYETVHKVQDHYKLTPLSAWKHPEAGRPESGHEDAATGIDRQNGCIRLLQALH